MKGDPRPWSRKHPLEEGVVWAPEVRVGHLSETLFECSYFNAAEIWAYLSVSGT